MDGPRPGPLAQLRAGRLPRRLVNLFVGLTLYGASESLIIAAGLGNIPWDVLHVGISHHTPLAVGTVSILVALVVLLLWIPLRQMPGLGTVANAVWIGLVINAVLPHLHLASAWWVRAGTAGLGVVLNGLATALYIGAQLGPGPRDGLMTGLHRVTGVSLRAVRTLIEVVVVLLGWLLGGAVGVATVVYALAIGPLTQAMLPRCTVTLPGVAATGRGGRPAAGSDPDPAT